MDDWGPVQIHEIQFLRAGNPEQMTPPARQALAEEVLSELLRQVGKRDQESIPDPVREWIDRFADLLCEAGAGRLKKLATELGIEANEGPPDDDPKGWARVVARRLLHFGAEPPVGKFRKEEETFEKAFTALEKAIYSLLDTKEVIADEFFPIWVNPDAARQILPISAGAPPRLVCINGTEPETGRFYADRATCGGASRKKAVVWAPDIHDGDLQELWKELDRKLKRELRLRDLSPNLRQEWNDALENRIKLKGGSVFVFLYGEARRPELLKRLVEKYPFLTFVLMVGDRVLDPAKKGFDKCRLIQPALRENRDVEIGMLYDQIVARRFDR